jgi:hypothetical protein
MVDRGVTMPELWDAQLSHPWKAVFISEIVERGSCDLKPRELEWFVNKGDRRGSKVEKANTACTKGWHIRMLTIDPCFG